MRIKDYDLANNIHPNDVLIIDGPEGTRTTKRENIVPEVYEAEAWANGTMDGISVPEQHRAYHNNAKYHAQNAANSATSANASKEAAAESEANASTSETNASTSEANAAISEANAADSATSAASSASDAAASAASIEGDVTKSNQNALRAEGHAVGKQNGIDVDSTSPYYHNNAEYWANYARRYAEGGIHYKESIEFADIPTSGMIVGDMYDILDDFVTDNRFQKGAGQKCKAGTNIIWNANGKWDTDIQGSGDEFDANIVAPVEVSPSAHAYNKDNQLIYNGKLYTVIEDIAIGDELINVDYSFNHKTWNGLTSFDGIDIWTDGENIYYSHNSDQYVLDKATSTWIIKTWNDLTSFEGRYIWTDGENIYYSIGGQHRVLDKSTSTWNAKTWNGLTSFSGYSIWTDEKNIYYSNVEDQYILDKATSTWNFKTWNGLTEFEGEWIWTDGENIYYSLDSEQYVLDKSNSTWIIKTWNGLTEFEGEWIWTDGENIYYSHNSDQYVLDKATSTWKTKEWSGLTNFSSSAIWSDGENIYYSYGSLQYVFIFNNITLSDPIVEQIASKGTVDPGIEIDYLDYMQLSEEERNSGDYFVRNIPINSSILPMGGQIPISELYDTTPTIGSPKPVTSDGIARNIDSVTTDINVIELTTTAEHPHSVGDYFMLIGQFVKCIAAIEIGDTIVMDTNVKATNIAEVLSQLNSKMGNTDISGIGSTVTAAIDNLSHANNNKIASGSTVSLTSTSSSNKYTCPNDGYVDIYYGANAGQQGWIRIAGSNNDSMEFLLGTSSSRAYEHLSIFVRKGMKVWNEGSGGNLSIAYYPLTD